MFTIDCKSPDDRLLLQRELCGRMSCFEKTRLLGFDSLSFSTEMIPFTLDTAVAGVKYTAPGHDVVCLCLCCFLGRAFVPQTSSLGNNPPPTYFKDSQVFPPCPSLRSPPRGEAARARQGRPAGRGCRTGEEAETRGDTCGRASSPGGTTSQLTRTLRRLRHTLPSSSDLWTDAVGRVNSHGNNIHRASISYIVLGRETANVD